MIFFLNLNGTCTRQDTDHIYQGSNNASKVIAITGIAPGQSRVDVAFTLPNGLTVGYLPMAYKGAYKLEDSSAVSMHLWELNLSYNVTEMQGTVGVSFNAVTGITEENPKGNNLTSYTNTFDVEYSALPELPSSATESELEQILNLLEAYAAVNPGIVEKLENFQIGTITAQAGEPGTQPRVTAEIVNKSLPNGYDLNMNFTLPTGEPAGFNRVTAEAETISAGSFAEADVTTSGPNTSKNFAFKFKIPKGDKGTSGQDGLDGAGVFALKQVYDSTTTKIPASDVEIPAGRYGQIKEFDMLIDTSGNMFRALAGNTPLNGNIITVRYYTSIKGEIGNTPDITVNATVDNTVGTPSVTVTESGTPEAPEINLSFHNLKGEPGDVSDYRQGKVNLKSYDIGSVARDTFFTAQSQTVDSYIKVFKSGIATYEWDTISMVIFVSDKNANNIKIGSVGYRVTYQMRGANTPLFEIERLFGNEEPDIRLYINYNNKAYQADRNYFEIYWKVGYGGDDAKIFQVINYSNRSGDINDFEQYTGFLAAEENPTSLGAFNPFKTYVKTSYLEKSGGTMTGRLNLNADGVYVNDGVNNQQVVWAKDDGDSGNYGCELFVEGRGNTFVGSGESPHNLNNELRAGNLKTGEQYDRAGENFYISSDSNILFSPNCNTIGNRGVIRLDSGALSMYSPNLNKWVRMCDDRLDISAAPAANQYNGLEIFDKNNDYVSNFRFMNAPEYKATQMSVRSSVDGTLRQAGVEVAINNDGTKYFRPYENNTTDLGKEGQRWKNLYATTIVPTLLYSSNNPTTGNVSIINGPFSKYKNLYMVIGNSDAYGSIYSMDLGFAKYWNIDGLAANYPSISVRLYNNNTLNIFQMGTQTKFIRIFGF